MAGRYIEVDALGQVQSAKAEPPKKPIEIPKSIGLGAAKSVEAGKPKSLAVASTRLEPKVLARLSAWEEYQKKKEMQEVKKSLFLEKPKEVHKTPPVVPQPTTYNPNPGGVYGYPAAYSSDGGGCSRKAKIWISILVSILIILLIGSAFLALWLMGIPPFGTTSAPGTTTMAAANATNPTINDQPIAHDRPATIAPITSSTTFKKGP